MTNPLFYPWFSFEPTDSELAPVPYYHHYLPDNLPEIVVTVFARRSINEGKNLKEMEKFFLNQEKPLIGQMVEILKSDWTEEDAKRAGYSSLKEFLKERASDGRGMLKLLKHAAIYQEQILAKEFGGKFPFSNRELLKMKKTIGNSLKK